MTLGDILFLMTIFLIITSLVLLVISLYNQKDLIKKTEKIPPKSSKPSVLSQNTDIKPSTSAAQSKVDSKVEVKITPPAPPPTPQPPTSNSNTDDLKYPNSSKQEDNKFQTGDHPDAVTNWYKEKINQMKMSSKSFVTTKTNEKVLNKLVAADGNKEIKVTISREENSSNTIIEITVNS